MATYNGERYLREQLDSIFLQKDVNVSILVRDDGSKDGTLQILDEYKNKYQLDWYNGPHLNVAKGYLELIKKAAKSNYDYIAFSDQDDVWDHDKLKIAIDCLEKFDNELPALYYCGQRLVDQDLNYISTHNLNSERDLKTRFLLSDFAGCTGVFNRTLAKKVAEYEPSYILMHDTWVLKICLALGGNVYVDTESHMNYRQHSNNTLGLRRGLSGYVKQVKQYINEYKVEPQMIELMNGYKGQIVPNYYAIVKRACNYRKIKNKIYFLNKKNFDFKNKGLNLTYNLKLILNKF